MLHLIELCMLLKISSAVSAFSLETDCWRRRKKNVSWSKIWRLLIGHLLPWSRLNHADALAYIADKIVSFRLLQKLLAVCKACTKFHQFMTWIFKGSLLSTEVKLNECTSSEILQTKLTLAQILFKIIILILLKVFVTLMLFLFGGQQQLF